MVTQIARTTGRRRVSAPYKLIENDLRRKIRHGVWQFGTQIPSRLQLAREYGVDLSTLQKAVSSLLADGVVRSDGKRGTYVNVQASDLPYDERDEQVAKVLAPKSPGERFAADTPLASAPIRTRNVAVVGRFAPEISFQLVPYIIALAFENEVAGDKSIALHFSDCFRDLLYSVPFDETVREALKQPVDALCVIDPEGGDHDAIVALARQAKTPLLFLSPQLIDQPAPQVYIDYRHDGYQAANYLMELGHRQMQFVSLGDHYWVRERLAGVLAAVRHAGLPESAVSVFPTGQLGARPMKLKEFREPLKAWVRNQIERGTLAKAIIAANDVLALDVLDALGEFGAEKAKSVAVVGFDDIPEARRRGLTTMRPPHFDMAREGARLLRVLLEKGEVRGESTHVRLMSQLVVRASA